MNRMEICFGKEVQQNAEDAFQLKGSSVAKRTNTSFTTFAPLHYEPNYAYPLIVWLHGSGDSENQLRRVMPKISLRNYAAVAPRGTSTIGSQIEGGHGWRQTPSEIEQAHNDVVACIEAASLRFHVASNRVFLAGFGAGGTMALRVAMTYPELFAGVASLAGEFPSGHCPLSRIGAARGTPVFLAHGRNSVNYREDRVCDDLRLLHSAGISVTLRQYPCSDELTAGMMKDLDVWLMQIVTGQSRSGSDAFPTETSGNSFDSLN